MPKKRRGERPDGLIQVSLTVPSATGKPARKYFYGHTRAEAEAKRDEYRAALNRPVTVDRDISVSEWVARVLATYRASVNAAYRAQDAIPYRKLSAAFGAAKVRDIREADLQSLLNSTVGMSYSTAEKLRQAMRLVFRKARINGIIDADPSEELHLPATVKGTHRALDPWEVALIRDNWSVHPAGLWCMLMLYAGLRRGEMMALDWSAVDLNARFLSVVQTAVIHSNGTTIEQRAKTEAGVRRIPIADPLYRALSLSEPATRSGFVCVSTKGEPLTESACSRGIETFTAMCERILNGEPPAAAGRRTDLEHDPDRQRFAFRTHDLRHTFCTFLYQAGVDVKTAAYLMGHADTRVTMEIYTHLTEQSKEDGIAKLNRFLQLQ